mgnify:FL=1
MAQSPSDTDPGVLRDGLTNPNVNLFEHMVNWPRFKAMLPLSANRVLDFGCGAGNFTEELATLYPDAEVVGVDAAEAMLPEEIALTNLDFKVWDGRMPLDSEHFDLIVAKMSLHYLDETEFRAVVANICRLLTENGTVAISVPHPANVWPRNEAKRDRHSAYHHPGNYKRLIGSTGIQGTMVHRSMCDLIEPFHARLCRGWDSMAFDEPVDKNNMPKRLNIFFLPKGSEEILEMYERLRLVEQGVRHEEVFLVDMDTPEGRHVLNGSYLRPTRQPLP